METFKIEIQEFLSRIVEIEAENIDDAVLKVKEMYIYQTSLKQLKINI